MAQSLYLFRAGWLRRAQNTLLLQDTTGHKHHLPVETIRDLFAMGPLRLSASTLRFLGQKGIPVHFFTHYGTYAGTYWPRQRHTSGQLVITQVQHALDPEKRLSIARQIVSGAIQQMRKNLLYYQQRGRDFSAILDYIAQREAHLPHTQSLAELMGEEGKVRSAYYQAWQAILGLSEPFLRSRRPPATLPNALLSFLNTLLYTATLSELYHTPSIQVSASSTNPAPAGFPWPSTWPNLSNPSWSTGFFSAYSTEENSPKPTRNPSSTSPASSSKKKPAKKSFGLGPSSFRPPSNTAACDAPSLIVSSYATKPTNSCATSWA